jgi:predicted outer membrane repeat protein
LVNAYNALTQAPPENYPPVFTSTGPFSVLANSGEGTVVGDINANNGSGGGDDGGITYSITANVNPDADGEDAFAINVSTGVITVNDAGDMNYSLNTSLTITVGANNGFFTSTANVTVYLIPITTTIIYVAWDASGANNGTSWANAYTSLQTALAAASSGDSVFVKYGTYKPAEPSGDRDATFNIPSGVAVVGHFAGTESASWQRNLSNDTYETILSGDLNGDDVEFSNNGENSHHVVSFYHVSSLTLLDGFTISHGNSAYWGGGILNNGSSGSNISEPTIRNCYITLNFATTYGAGIMNDSYGSEATSTPIIDHCTFVRNSCSPSSLGGAIYNSECKPIISNCIFIGNYAQQGASVLNSGWCFSGGGAEFSNCVFRNTTSWAINEGAGVSNLRATSSFVSCSFRSNTAQQHGGGIYNYEGNITISDCVFDSCNVYMDGTGPYIGGGSINSESGTITINNTSFSNGDIGTSLVTSDGGAILFATGTLNLRNCSFTGNKSKTAGGAVHATSTNTSIINCLLSGNNALTNSGAISCTGCGSVSIINSTMSGNKANGLGGGLYNSTSTTTITNSIIWGNLGVQDGNEIYNSSSTLTVSYSDVKNCGSSGPLWDATLGTDGGSNIEAYPMFYDYIEPTLTPTSAGNYRLFTNSPAIDIGNNAVVTLEVDLDSNARIQNGTVDLGPYEGGLNKIIFVKHDASGLNNGQNWTNAYNDLQDALSEAVRGDRIFVARGTYYPDGGLGTRTSTYNIPAGVEVYGHFEGTEEIHTARDLSDEANETILSGNIGSTGVNTDNSYHVVTFNNVDNSTLLDALTISGGYGDGAGNNNKGGAIYSSSSSYPVFSNCNFENNYAVYGGAVYNYQNSSPAFEECVFESNSAANGGAIYNLNNSSPDIISCFFKGNSATTFGGAIGNEDNSSPRLVNCVISGNYVSSGSGGVFYNLNSSPEIINCSIAGNNSSAAGSVAYNSASSPLFKNTIIWGNNTSAGLFTNANGSSPGFAYCDVETSGGSSSWDASLGVDNGGNIDANPIFEEIYPYSTAPFSGNYLHLYTGSPCSNAGNNSFMPSDITTDIHGAARIQNTTIDMGAYEGVEARRKIYVDAAASGIANGFSWANAFNTIEQAYAVALAGDSIYVKAGTYKPTDVGRSSTYTIVSGIALFGHFAGTESNSSERDLNNPAYETILSGDIGTVGVNTDNCYHVMTIGPVNTSTIINGFTITKGYADGSGSNCQGGGIYLSGWDVRPNIYHCKITNNYASSGGGGIFFKSSGGSNKVQADVRYCTISYNTCAGGGGGVYGDGADAGLFLTPLTYCTISNNTASAGGGLFYSGNNGGYLIYSNITNCIISGNTATESGGGIYFDFLMNTQAPTPLINCLITGNTSVSGHGGGVNYHSYTEFPPTITMTNCTFSANKSGNTGDAVYFDNSITGNVRNCIFPSNTFVWHCIS